MKLVHMSDIHLTAPGKTIGGRDPRLNFERALTDILKCHHDAELLVITGDLSDWGDRDDYEWLKARLDRVSGSGAAVHRQSRPARHLPERLSGL